MSMERREPQCPLDPGGHGAGDRRAGVAVAELRPDLPTELCDAIDACLQPDPELRPPLEELSAAIEETLPDLEAGRSVPRPRRRRPSLADAMAALTGGGPAELASPARSRR